MNRYLLSAALLAVSLAGMAQRKGFSYNFYGQVRADAFVNTRANKESADGIVNYFPLDRKPDAVGRDLNATQNAGFYTLYSRVGLDVKGPDLRNGRLHTSAKAEIDFRGSSTSYSIARLRHFYFRLDWSRQSMLVGQAWHPFYGDVVPEVLNLSMGAPYQPFSRAPQALYTFSPGAFKLRAGALWQVQYLSYGLENKGTEDMIKKSCVPEVLVGADYVRGPWLAGVNASLLSLVPRTQATANDKVYKVSERVTSVSAEAHVRYKTDRLSVQAKTVWGSNQTQLSTVGGFAATSTHALTGERSYTPLHTSATWASVSYGRKLRPTVFGGYIKNLGAGRKVTEVYGNGTDVDQMFLAGANLTYNLPAWKFGLEYAASAADYGTTGDKGRVTDTHRVVNHRTLATAIFLF